MALMIVRTLISNVATFLALRGLSPRSRSQSTLTPDRRVFFVLPVLSETAMIGETLLHLFDIVDSRNGVGLVIVGTSRERDNSLNNPTLAIASELSDGRSNVQILELETETGGMAHQINFAVSELVATGLDISKTWIYILNIDSRLSATAVDAVLDLVNHNTPVIQQSALFLTNYRKIGWFERGVALCQSRWTISHEITRLWLHNRVRFHLAHVVGHGLCINISKLLEYGLLPTDKFAEDMHFGFYLAASAESIVPVGVLELADSPATMLGALRQKYVWSFGPMLYPKYLLDYVHRFPERWRANRLAAMLVALQGVLSYLSWLTSSWIILACLLAAADSPAAMVFILLYLTEHMQCNIFFYRQGYIPLSDLLLSPIIVLIGILVHSFPADKALMDIVLKRNTTKYKTDHH